MKIGPDGALYLTDWIIGLGLEEQRPALEARHAGGGRQRHPQGGAGAAAGGLRRHGAPRTWRRCFVTGHARAPEGAVRSRAPRGRRDARSPRRAIAAHLLARLHGLWGVAQLARTRGAPRAVARRLPRRRRRGGAGAGGSPDRRRPVRRRQRSAASAAQGSGAARPVLRGRGSRARRVQTRGRRRWSRCSPGTTEAMRMLQHAGSLALASMGDAAALEALASHASHRRPYVAVVALRRMRHAGVARFLADADERGRRRTRPGRSTTMGRSRRLSRSWRRCWDRRAAPTNRCCGARSTPTSASARREAIDARRGARRRRVAPGSAARRGDRGAGRLACAVADGSRRRVLSGLGGPSGDGSVGERGLAAGRRRGARGGPASHRRGREGRGHVVRHEGRPGRRRRPARGRGGRTDPAGAAPDGHLAGRSTCGAARAADDEGTGAWRS